MSKQQQLFPTSSSSAADSRAKTYPARERARALLASARACGLSLPGSLENSGRGGSLSRTSPQVRPDGLIRSWPGWRNSIIKRFRSLCRHAMSALHTEEHGFLSWATHTVVGNQLSPSMAKWPSCKAIQDMLPTPSASSYGSNRGGAAGRTGPVRESLETMARNGSLPTPQARDMKGPPGKACQERGGHQSSLPSALGQSTRCLNPRFVEWMMGFPLLWTETQDSKPSETQLSPNARK